MTTEPRSETVNIRVTPSMRAWLEGRGARTTQQHGPSTRARVELELWRRALEVEAARTAWTLAEITVLAQVQNSTIVDDAIPLTIGTLAMQVQDAAANRLLTSDELRRIGAVAAKATQLGPTADMASVDAIARWWEAGADHTPDGWGSVGLTVIEDNQ